MPDSAGSRSTIEPREPTRSGVYRPMGRWTAAIDQSIEPMTMDDELSPSGTIACAERIWIDLMTPSLDKKWTSRRSQRRPEGLPCSGRDRCVRPDSGGAGEPGSRRSRNPDLHRLLADHLLAMKETHAGIEELDLALMSVTSDSRIGRAARSRRAACRCAPDRIRHHQKRVELAFRMGDRGPLLDAYLSLGDALARAGAKDKAVAVFQSGPGA